MPAIKTRKPTVSSAPQMLRVDDLSGGLELRRSASLLQPDQARLLRNWSLREPGALVVYPGWKSFSTTSLGSRRLQGGQRIYVGATPFTLASDNGNVYKPSDAGVWGSAVLTGRSTTTQHYFPSDRTLAAVFDSTNVPKKTTDGTTWTQMGISAPTVAPTASAVAGGALIAGDTYEVSYSYKDDELAHEGNESATVQQAAAGANLTVRVSVTASADAQVDTITVYVRDVTAGETVRRKYATYTNTTTTHDITSNTWSSNVEAPTDHTVPLATLRTATIWKNRWWAEDTATKNRLYFTQIFQPQSWPSTFYIDMPFERGDEIAAKAAQGDALIVFGKTSKGFVIIGQTSLDFEVRPALGMQGGAFGPRAIEVIENGIIHAEPQGVFIYDGAGDRLLSYNIDPGWRDLVQHATADDLGTIACVYHGLTKELRLGVTRLYPWGAAGEWILDLNRTRTQQEPAWTSTDRPSGGYLHWNGNEPTLGNYGRLFSWPSSATAKLYEESTGTDADGANQVADYEGSTHATGGHIAAATDGYLEFQPGTGTFALTPIVDGAAIASQNVSINTGILPWGTSTAPYGTASRLWGGKSRAYQPFDLPLEAEGRTHAVRARYSGKAAFKFYTYGLRITPESELMGM